MPHVTPESPTVPNDIKVPVIWILGGPCSGKGTQCTKIRTKYGFVHISTGDLLREEVDSGCPRGQRLLKIMNAGELVPNEIVMSMLKNEMLCTVCRGRGFLIDGYPRTAEQGLMFERQVAPVMCVLYFDTTDTTMLNRMMERAKSSDRTDDNEKVMKKRVENFNREKESILEVYAAKIKKIDANRPADEVFADVEEHLNLIVKISPM